MKPFDPRELTERFRRQLPHWRQEGTTYFVTFRLADSLPQAKLRQWEAEREQWLRARLAARAETPSGIESRFMHKRGRLCHFDWRAAVAALPEEDQHQYHVAFTKRLQDYLDAGYGACWLRDPVLSGIVETALRFFDEQRYGLGRFVIMPNHVHVLVTPLAEHKLSEIEHSWKSFTAKQINCHLRRNGGVWEHESFDHIVRSEEQLRHFEHYVAENPMKAGLKLKDCRCG